MKEHDLSLLPYPLVAEYLEQVCKEMLHGWDDLNRYEKGV